MTEEEKESINRLVEISSSIEDEAREASERRFASTHYADSGNEKLDVVIALLGEILAEIRSR